MPPARPEDNDNEGTPLLLNDGPPLKPTPFPAAQASVLMLPWIAEAVVALSISPYINQVRKSFGSMRDIRVDLPLACSRSSNRGWRWAKGGVLHGNHRTFLKPYFYERRQTRWRHRCPCIMLQRRSPCFIGTAYPITLAASPFSCVASRVRLLQ
jgi:hypothetical protein